MQCRSVPSYLCEGAACLRSHARQKQQQFEEMQNALDLVGFESEVCVLNPIHPKGNSFKEAETMYYSIAPSIKISSLWVFSGLIRTL